MKCIHAIILFQFNEIIGENYDLDIFNIFVREKAKESIKKLCIKLIDQFEKNKIYIINMANYSSSLEGIECYFLSNNNYSCYLITHDYPSVGAATRLLYHVLTNFPKDSPELISNYLKEIMDENQDPTKADKFMKVQGEVEDVKKILIDAIDNVLDRYDKIENLVQKTEELNEVSVTFKKKAKDLNRCCVIL